MSHLRKYRDIKFRAETLERIGVINRVIETYERDGFALTLRQLYYQLVTKNIIPNSDPEYKRLGALLSDARLAGLVSWTSIEDRGRNLKGHETWDGPVARMWGAHTDFRLDKWARQPVRPEVWVEKHALEGVVGHICSELDVDFFAPGGYNSQSNQWMAGRRMAGRIARGQRPVVIHLGDHDPSGFDMTRDNLERLSLFAGTPVQVVRVALNPDQVARYNPPPNPAKVSDPRYEDYRRLHGDESWELDALSPRTIHDIVREAVAAFRNERLWDEALQEENAQRQQVADMLEQNFGSLSAQQEDDDDDEE